VRSHREEAVLSCLAGSAGLQLRHARLRSALRLLPELGDVSSPARSGGGRAASDVDPDDLVADALRQGARVVVSTYNEPLITVEWAVEVFKAARARGLATGFVSNGNGTSQVIEYLAPWIDLYKVDLKSFDDKQYRKLGGRLLPILETIRSLHARACGWRSSRSSSPASTTPRQS
jgi:pyruvate-formate lyase-activating enzyme